MGDHTESIQIDFDPDMISYERLLELFWANHSSYYRSGTQYKSAIWYHDSTQEALAKESMEAHKKESKRTIYTTIDPAKADFTLAEDYHQKYSLRHYKEVVKALNLSNKDLIDSPISAKLNGYLGNREVPENFEMDLLAMGVSDELVALTKESLEDMGYSLACGRH